MRFGKRTRAGGLAAATQEPEQDQEQVNEVEVEAEGQQQGAVVEAALGLDAPEIEEREADEDHPQEGADGQLRELPEENGPDAEHDPDQEGSEEPLTPGCEVEARDPDDRARDQEDPHRPQ